MIPSHAAMSTDSLLDLASIIFYIMVETINRLVYAVVRILELFV
jgi:hypothetical protein